MFLFQFIPPPSFSPPLHPSPIYSPLLLSPLAHPIPQTNQFSCLPSILLSMPAPTLSFVLCRDLHFQRPHINLSFMPPSIRHPPPISPPPTPHSPFKECRLWIQPLLLIITQFHSGRGLCMSEYNCLYVCSLTRCEGNSLYCQQTGEGGGIWVGDEGVKAPLPVHVGWHLV